MKTFQFGNFETEIDPTDVDFIKTYDTAAEKYQQDMGAAAEKAGDLSTWAYMDRICSVFFTFFDTVLGNGACEKMFGKRRSVDLCADALNELKECVQDYESTIRKLQTGAANRAQRRALKKAVK